jgi:hypothetical protein
MSALEPAAVTRQQHRARERRTDRIIATIAAHDQPVDGVESLQAYHRGEPDHLGCAAQGHDFDDLRTGAARRVQLDQLDVVHVLGDGADVAQQARPAKDRLSRRVRSYRRRRG